MGLPSEGNLKTIKSVASHEKVHGVVMAIDIDFGFGKPKRRTLKSRDKQILYRRAKGKCEACGKKISYIEMHVGHKTAAAKGGSATLRNSACLCPTCNKLQGTDSWAVFMRKLGKKGKKSVTAPKRKKKRKKKKGFWDIGIDIS